MVLKDHEKFIAFCLLGAALVGLAMMVYLKPPSTAVLKDGAALNILSTIIGALTLAFGGAANALFKITSSEKAEIGKAAAEAVAAGPPVQTTVVNDETQPVPTTTEEPAAASTSSEELPDYAR